uniref:Fatty acid hydroxylase domain-containing protein n=1 Tax=Ditylenchus dipsaci TaxID=166011 RepID=A0A915EI31_9BILA
MRNNYVDQHKLVDGAIVLDASCTILHIHWTQSKLPKIWVFARLYLYRGVFHWKPDLDSYNQITFHSCSTASTTKPYGRGAPGLSTSCWSYFVSIFYVLYRVLLPWPIFCCYASGKLFGYICYDMTHYYLHHGSPEPSSNMHFKKVYHHNHHFKDVDMAFGISTVFWDHVFNTVGTGPL